MPDRKRNAKNQPSGYSEGQSVRDDGSYKRLYELCYQISGEKNKSLLETYSKDFTQAADHISQEINDSKKKIASIPFIVVILVWAEFVERDKIFGPRYVDMMCELISTGIIPYENSEGKLLIMQEFKSLDATAIIDVIRGYPKWLEHKRENYVIFFIEFINWLFKATFGYIQQVQDPDRQLTSRRQLPYETYIEIITALSLREKIIAKIFYLGGNRSLDEILSLKIGDIDYSEHKLNLSGCWVVYPKHVLEDLNSYIGKRKKGFVFIGRDGSKTDPSVPYRALKTVASKLDLDPAFTFKDFAKNA